LPEIISLKLLNREIYINNYLIAKPHAVGRNFEFLEYIIAGEPNIEITRKDMPEWLQNQIQGVKFGKILSDLKFKGEIRKAFFYKVNDDSLYFRGKELSLNEITNHIKRVDIFIKELELLQLKYH
jgi:hypothetical protein